MNAPHAGSRSVARRLIQLAGLLAASTFLVAACGERGDVTSYKQGKYQGKADAKPYEAGPTAYSQSSKWNAGDRAGWENAIKTRQQSQDEYQRTP
jgi:hypothetical protein